MVTKSIMCGPNVGMPKVVDMKAGLEYMFQDFLLRCQQYWAQMGHCQVLALSMTGFMV